MIRCNKVNFMYIYVLSLSSNKFYIGKTEVSSKHLKDHTAHIGLDWTTKYEPIDVIEVINMDSYNNEDTHTLKYMKKVGLNNVRGGSFIEMVLDKSVKKKILKLIKRSKSNSVNKHKIDEVIKLLNKRRIVTKSYRKLTRDDLFSTSDTAKVKQSLYINSEDKVRSNRMQVEYGPKKFIKP